MGADKPVFEYDLTVSGVSPEQAEAILESITLLVEFYGGQVAGGFTEAKDEREDVDTVP